MTDTIKQLLEAERRLERVLDALGAEILAATDEEIASVLAERGIKLGMKGSAALLDLIDPRIAPPAAHDQDENPTDDPPPRDFPILPRRQ